MAGINTSANATKEEARKSVEKYLTEVELAISSHDFSRPWGGFFVIDESLSERLYTTLFLLI